MMTRSATPPRETSRMIRGGFTWKEGNFFKNQPSAAQRTYQELKPGSMALEEKDHLDHAHAPDQPHSCKDHFGDHEETRKPCVFKPHRDATKRHRGGAEGKKDSRRQMGRWYVN